MYRPLAGDYRAFFGRIGILACRAGVFFLGGGSRSAASRRAERSPPLGAPPSSFHRSMDFALLRRLRSSGISIHPMLNGPAAESVSQQDDYDRQHQQPEGPILDALVNLSGRSRLPSHAHQYAAVRRMRLGRRPPDIFVI
jgi:hypothetical protein